MAWSRQASGRQPEARAQPMAAPSAASKLRQAKKREPARPATRRVAKLPTPVANPLRGEEVNKPATKIDMDPAPAATASVPAAPPDPRADTENGTPPAQVATVPKAEELAKESPPALPPSSESKVSAPIAVEPPSDAKTATETNTAALPTAKAEQTIAILLVREEIKSLADLSNKRIAIDANQANEVPNIKAAISKTGARDVEIIEDAKFALLRVIDGEVPAGVISIASPEEAAQWTGVPGYTVLKLPLLRTKGSPG